jgi:ATP-dependent Clp protease ATP-binding subunit ClpA
MLSSELESCLNGAFAQAREARHEFLTVEHLLLSIIDAPRVREILKAGGADIRRLADELRRHIDETTPKMKAGEDDREVQPTLGFQRVLQRAVFQVQSGGRREVAVADVLVAIFSEKQSHAVFLLNRHEITRLDVKYISHGLPKGAEEKVGREEQAPEGERDPEGGSALEKLRHQPQQGGRRGSHRPADRPAD